MVYLHNLINKNTDFIIGGTNDVLITGLWRNGISTG